MNNISNELLVKGVVCLGLRQSEAEIYVHLAIQGPQKARAIAEELKINEQLVYRSLRRLKSKEIVRMSLRRPVEFSAIPLDKALELLIKAHLKKTQNIEHERDEILNQWHSMITKQGSLKRISY